MVKPINQSTPLPQQPTVEPESSTSDVQGASGAESQGAAQSTAEASNQSAAPRTSEGYTAARVAEHSISGQARAAQLNSQIVDREVRGRVYG